MGGGSLDVGPLRGGLLVDVVPEGVDLVGGQDPLPRRHRPLPMPDLVLDRRLRGGRGAGEPSRSEWSQEGMDPRGGGQGGSSGGCSTGYIWYESGIPAIYQ